MKTFLRVAPIVAVAFLICLVWFEWQAYLNRYFVLPKNLEQKAQYGDSYGSLNSLFAGLALIGVIYTIAMQVKDAKQREEETKRHENENKKLEHERYEDRFEARFFRLLDLWYSYVSGLEHIEITWQRVGVDFDSKSRTLRGKAVISRIWDTAYGKKYKQDTKATSKLAPLDDFIKRYTDTFTTYEEVLSPYFRSLYHVFKYVDKADIKDKKQYTDIVRAILSGTELSLLAANCLTEYGEKNFKPLLVKFELLKHLPSDKTGPITIDELKKALGITV